MRAFYRRPDDDGAMSVPTEIRRKIAGHLALFEELQARVTYRDRR